MLSNDAILDAAESIHREEGLTALSLRRVADALSVTPMALYRYFDDKDALLDALVARGFAMLEQYLAIAARKRTPAARLRAGLQQYREFALAHPRWFELMFLIQRRNVPDPSLSLKQTTSPAFGAMIAAVSSGMERGDIRAGDIASTILLLWSTAHGLIALHFSGRFGGEEMRFRRVFDAAIDDLLRMLRSKP